MNRTASLRKWIPQYKANLALAGPVVLSQIGQVIVQLSDNLMVARLGALPLAAVSFGGAVFTIFLFWGTGLSLGLTPLTGEAYAQRKIRTTAGLLQNALVLYSLVGLLLFGVLWDNRRRWCGWPFLITVTWHGASFPIWSTSLSSNSWKESEIRAPAWPSC